MVARGGRRRPTARAASCWAPARRRTCPSAAPLPGDAVHSSGYLSAKEELQAKDSIAVVGGGQSAAEIFHDLLEEIDDHDYELTWITRSERFFPLEYTKLTLEMTSPEYLEYFHRLPAPVRDEPRRLAGAALQGDRLRADRRDLPAALPQAPPGPAADDAADQHRAGRRDLRRRRGRYDGLRHVEQEQAFELAAEGAGAGHRLPLRVARSSWSGSPTGSRGTSSGRFAVRRNYTIDATGGEVFVQNAELHTHGFVAPDLGMAAYRNSCIIRELLGREHYPIEHSIAFQEFGAPEEVRPIAELRAPVDPEADAELLHAWVTHPKSAFWLMGDADVDGSSALPRHRRGAAHDAFIGLHEGEPAFLVERYDPAHDEIGEVYEVREGDVGMHFLVAPDRRAGPRLHARGDRDRDGADVLRPGGAPRGGRARRAQHGRARAERGGRLPARRRGRAAEQARAAELLHARGLESGGSDDRAPWRTSSPTAGRRPTGALVAKALVEFAHERLLDAEPSRRRWDPQRRRRGGLPLRGGAHGAGPLAGRPGRSCASATASPGLDALALALELRDTLGLEGEQAGLYLEELTSTLSAMAYKLAAPRLSAAELAARRLPDDRGGYDRGPPVLRGQQRPARASTPPTTSATRPRRRAGAAAVGGRAPRPHVSLGARARLRRCSERARPRDARALPRSSSARSRRLPARSRSTRGSGCSRLAVTFAADVAAAGSCASATATTSTSPSSRSARSSTRATRRATTSRRRCRW